MDRKAVYAVIDGERDYQEEQAANHGRPDIRPQLNLGETILAMETCLQRARDAWYNGAEPHPGAMDQLRRVIALGVQAAEVVGIPER